MVIDPSLGPWILVAGTVIGLLYGIFGVGTAFATPVLSMMGVPGLAAVVAPLPAILPSSAVSAYSYARRGTVDWQLVRWCATAGLPAAVVGAIVSQWVGGPALLVISGLVPLVVGYRILRPGSPVDVVVAARLRSRPAVVGVMAAGVGFSAGLLANGGGFLLVPLFLLLLGLDMNAATGTSLLIASTLTAPTLATHLLLGDVDWTVALWFALGVVPAAAIGARIAPRIDAARLRRGFGFLLVGFAAVYLVHLLAS